MYPVGTIFRTRGYLGIICEGGRYTGIQYGSSCWPNVFNGSAPYILSEGAKVALKNCEFIPCYVEV